PLSSESSGSSLELLPRGLAGRKGLLARGIVVVGNPPARQADVVAEGQQPLPSSGFVLRDREGRPVLFHILTHSLKEAPDHRVPFTLAGGIAALGRNAFTAPRRLPASVLPCGRRSPCRARPGRPSPSSPSERARLPLP